MSDKDIEQAIQAAGANVAPRVTPTKIEANIVSEHYFTARDGMMGATPANHVFLDPPALSLLTFCVLVLRNGFAVTGESACASPENFNVEIGREIARQNAVVKVWSLMSYELRSKLAAKPTGFRDRVRLEAKDLNEKIEKLLAFLPTDTFSNLPANEQDRLNAQLAAMQDYSACLAARIRAFGSAA